MCKLSGSSDSGDITSKNMLFNLKEQRFSSKKLNGNVNKFQIIACGKKADKIPKDVRVAVLGASGYTGSEVLLINRTVVDIFYL